MELTRSDRLATTSAGLAADTTAGPRSRRRPWLVAEGVVGLVAGFLGLAWTDRAVDALAVLLGLGLLFAGGWLIGAALDAPAGRGRWQVAVLAVVSFAAGLCVLAYPDIGALALVGGGAAWLLVAGAHDLAVAWAGHEHRVLNAVVGVLSVVVAVSLLVPPAGGIFTDGTLALLAAAGLLARSVLVLALAARLRRSVG